ncbi:unnamed protein product [Prunus armeniaca]
MEDFYSIVSILLGYTAPKQDELVERYPGVARVVHRPQPTHDVASEREDIDDLLKFPHPLCGRFLKNAIDATLMKGKDSHHSSYSNYRASAVGPFYKEIRFLEFSGLLIFYSSVGYVDGSFSLCKGEFARHTKTPQHNDVPCSVKAKKVAGLSSLFYICDVATTGPKGKPPRDSALFEHLQCKAKGGDYITKSTSTSKARSSSRSTTTRTHGYTIF